MTLPLTLQLKLQLTARAVRPAALAALVVGVTGCATLVGARSLGRARPGVTSYHLLRVGGAARSFLLHLPPAAAAGPVPLVVVLHGHTGNGAVARDVTGFDAEADRRGVAVVYPEGSGVLRRFALSWNTGGGFGWAEAHGVDDVAFVDQLLDTLVARRWVDSTRVVVAGFSAGGMLALRLGCERAERFVGIVDVAGVMPDTACRPSRPLRVLLVQGDADSDLRREHAAARAAPAARRRARVRALARRGVRVLGASRALRHRRLDDAASRVAAGARHGVRAGGRRGARDDQRPPARVARRAALVVRRTGAVGRGERDDADA